MKIKDIKAVELKAQPPPMYSTKAERPFWFDGAEIANPMSRYPRYKTDRNSWRPKWGEVACVVTAEDGTWGLGMTIHGAPVVSIINDHLGPMLHGDDFMAIEKLWDMMFRLASPYSAAGMASYAISAVDLALWDLKGKILQRPVYELLGGPARDKIFCYATGNDTDWHMELGFKATKLACLYGAADGLQALDKNEEMAARTRELIGPHVELMLDCWRSTWSSQYGWPSVFAPTISNGWRIA